MNPDLNAIHDMLSYTFQCLSIGGDFVDCPQIERLGYGGDGKAYELAENEEKRADLKSGKYKISNVLQKKTQKTPKKEIDKAIRLMSEFFAEKQKEDKNLSTKICHLSALFFDK